MCESVRTVTPAQVGWPFQIFSTPPLFPGLSVPVLQSFSQSYNSTVLFLFRDRISLCGPTGLELIMETRLALSS